MEVVEEALSEKAVLPEQAEPNDANPVAREAASGGDSDATAQSTSEDTAQPSLKYGLRPKRMKHSKEGNSNEDSKEGAESKNEDDAVQNGGKQRRKRSNKQSGDTSGANDGLLRLAQIAHAAPRMPKKARTEKADATATENASQPAVVPPPSGQVEDPQQAELEQEPAAAMAAAEAPVGSGQEASDPVPIELGQDQKFSPAIIKAHLAAGQQINLPGFTPGVLPYVQLGARWQLDLRTGERLEEQHPVQMGLLPMQHLPGAQASFHAGPQGAPGPRPPIFTGAVSQAGGYTVVAPPAHTYGGPLAISSLGQQQQSQQPGSAAGPYTALLGSQMLNPGMVAHYMPHLAASTPQQPADGLPKKRQRAGNMGQFGELPEIPLRRRGRPAGDGAAAAVTPQELQERRMQANRAAASRSHFRRKREMELLEKESEELEQKLMDMRSSLQELLSQEDQLRLQQAGLREHLASGCVEDAPQEGPAPARGLAPAEGVEGDGPPPTSEDPPGPPAPANLEAA